MVWNESISGSLTFCESSISAKTLVLKLRPKIVTAAKTLGTKWLLLAWISPVFIAISFYGLYSHGASFSRNWCSLTGFFCKGNVLRQKKLTYSGIS